MKKLLKTLVFLACTALAGTSALADDYGWYDGAMAIGGVTTDFMTWSTDGNNPTDLGDCTDMTITSVAFKVWSNANDREGANMFFRIWDGGTSQVGADQNLHLGVATRITGDHDFAISWSGTEDLAAAVGLTLENGKTYYIDMWAKTYGNNHEEWYSANGANFHAKLTYIKSQTFNYNLNGGDSCAVMTLTLPVGSTYEGAVQAVWAGHVFRGWWTETTGGTRYQNGKSTVPDNGDEPIELYAHWSDAQVVQFNAGEGATCDPASVTLSQGETYWNFPTPTKEGCKFQGWYTAENGGTRVKNGDSPVTAEASRELFAHWVAMKVVTLNAMGGDCSKTSITRPVGDVYWGLPTAPTKQGCSFLGWYTEENGGTPVKNGTPVTAADPTTLYAHWREWRVVTLDATGGDCTKTSITRPVGDVYWGLPSSATKDGCKFLGWYTAETGGTRVRNGDTVNADDPTTLYAQWKQRVAAKGAAKASKAAPAMVVAKPVCIAVTASGGEDAGAVVDGDETTSWTPGTAEGSWVVLTLSNPCNVADVEVSGENLPEGTRFLLAEDPDDWSAGVPGKALYVWVVFPAAEQAPVVKEIRVVSDAE